MVKRSLFLFRYAPPLSTAKLIVLVCPYVTPPAVPVPVPVLGRYIGRSRCGRSAAGDSDRRPVKRAGFGKRRAGQGVVCKFSI